MQCKTRGGFYLNSKTGHKTKLLTSAFTIFIIITCAFSLTSACSAEQTNTGQTTKNESDDSSDAKVKALIKTVNTEGAKIEKKIQSVSKYNKKTKKKVNTYKNKKTKKLRKQTLKKINASNRYCDQATAQIDKAMKLAESGKSVDAVLKKAKSKYKSGYKASRSARKVSIKAVKLFRRTQTRSIHWRGSLLTRSGGVNYGPTGFETYYNLNMAGCIRMMRQMGYSAKKYPYWVRDDGCKMFGNYIMCGAYLPKYPKGTKVECSLGTCIVVDTGAMRSKNHLDIAVAW